MRSLTARDAETLSAKAPITALFITAPWCLDFAPARKHKTCHRRLLFVRLVALGMAIARMRPMRRLSVAAAMLLVVLLGCGRLSQRQDTLAPRVAAPEAPVPLTQAAAKPEPLPETSAREDTPVSALTSPVASPGAASSPASVVSPSPGGLAATPAPSASVSSKPAAPSSVPTSAPPSAASLVVAPTASRALLQPMQHEFETWNNCAPVTAEMVLSYYGISKRQTEIAPVLRPHA